MAQTRRVPTVRLPYREPMQLSALLDFLGAHAVPRRADYRDGCYRTVVDAAGGPALVTMRGGDGTVTCRLRLADPADEPDVLERVRRLLDLDADPTAVDTALAADEQLAPLIAKRPGLRVPGALDAFETTIGTIVGQQISVRGACTVLGRIVAAHGRPAFTDEPWLCFPTPQALAVATDDSLPMPRARARSVRAVAAAFADGFALDATADARAALLALPGVGPWTADYLRLRVTGDKDVLLDGDLVVRRAAGDLELDLGDRRPDWSPWRSYVTFHLWAHAYADLWSARP